MRFHGSDNNDAVTINQQEYDLAAAGLRARAHQILDTMSFSQICVFLRELDPDLSRQPLSSSGQPLRLIRLHSRATG